MKRPLSISSYNTYVECPFKYKMDKIERLRPKRQPSYFIFGSAVDRGLNAMLLEDGSPLEACEDELVRLITTDIEFLPMDYDGEIIDDVTKKKLLEVVKTFGYTGDDVDSLVSSLFAKGQENLSDNQRKALALCCTASLKAKAKLMLDAYKRHVMPTIRKVESVQKELRWVDAHGNEFIGVVDMIADGVVRDNKTASRPYDSDAVRTSAQLAIYTRVLNKDRAGFFVMEKMIRKNRVKTCKECGNDGTGKRHKTCDRVLSVGQRCNGEWSETIKPEVAIQFLTDVVPKHEQDITQEALTGVAESIKAGCFPKNLKSCRVKYGTKEVKCPYFEFCRTGSKHGLVKLEPSDK